MSITEKSTNTFFWNIMYWLVRFRAGFTAVILLAAAIFAYQYYLVLQASPATPSYPIISNETVSLTLFIPDKFLESALPESIDILELKNNITDTKDNQDLPVTVKVFRNKEEIYKNEFSWQETNLETVSIPAEEIFPDAMDADISKINIQVDTGEKILVLEKDVQLEYQSKNSFILISAILSFLTAFFSLINQIRTLTKK